MPATSDPFDVGVTRYLRPHSCFKIVFPPYSAEDDRHVRDFALQFPSLDISQTLGARASQAYAEVSVGPVAFFFTDRIHDGANMDPSTTWGGFEFPALTRNPSMKKIIQVDANYPLRDDNGNLNPRVIWQQSDGPSAQEPMGELFAYKRGFRCRWGRKHVGMCKRRCNGEMRRYGECEELSQLFAQGDEKEEDIKLFGQFRRETLSEKEEVIKLLGQFRLETLSEKGAGGNVPGSVPSLPNPVKQPINQSRSGKSANQRNRSGSTSDT